ncbi:MAG: RIP metalloprotease RseP [Candidatus Symbiodolus clandestinus]
MINTIVINSAAFLAALIPLVIIHELGHFLAARWCGVKVERFSIGLGPLLWRWIDQKGTEYAIAAIPLGGYVKMLDEQEHPVAESDRAQAFNHRPLKQRALIVIAGPLANFLLAFLAYSWIFWQGELILPPVVGTVVPQSMAAMAGVTPGMQLLEVAGRPTPDWDAVNQALTTQSENTPLVVTVRLPSSEGEACKQLLLPQGPAGWAPKSTLEGLGIIPKYPEILPVIASVIPGSAAADAGLQVGDRLLGIAGQPIEYWQQVVWQFQSHPRRPLILQVKRADQIIVLSITPGEKLLSNGQRIGYAGLAPQILPIPKQAWRQQKNSLLIAMQSAAQKTWEITRIITASIGQLLSGRASLKQLSGPLAIAKGASQAAAFGLSAFLAFVALISINLGIVNLLPLPVLDGGHLLFLLIEAICGKPASDRVQAISYRFGLLILLLLMGVALLNDLRHSLMN